jgi:hypothetical protein
MVFKFITSNKRYRLPYLFKNGKKKAISPNGEDGKQFAICTNMKQGDGSSASNIIYALTPHITYAFS